ncbi:hypothetical protein THRCLA_09336 [Thraustotheca clavata]|uniref:RING-type domain-containing protein n=1 Tax=Thraustotheca clavata TaxID=74557 RepID=A0A1V9YXN3_9STRA|nr:hypothetical protein THRCLA_09336 [Thraustotheca clavata]
MTQPKDEIYFLAAARPLLARFPAPTSPTLAPWNAVNVPTDKDPISLSSLSLPSLPLIDVSIGSNDHHFGYFVQYEITLKCPFKSTAWTIYKRYSEFDAFRRQLKHFTANSAVEYILHLPFPKKVLDAEKPQVIADRMHWFQSFANHLWSMYIATILTCTASCGPSLMQLIGEFLQVPPNVLDVTFKNVSQLPEDICVVCLDELNADNVVGNVVELSCGHLFHRGCLQDWFAKSLICPICRSSVDHVTCLHQ